LERNRTVGGVGRAADVNREVGPRKEGRNHKKLRWERTEKYHERKKRRERTTIEQKFHTGLIGSAQWGKKKIGLLKSRSKRIQVRGKARNTQAKKASKTVGCLITKKNERLVGDRFRAGKRSLVGGA